MTNDDMFATSKEIVLPLVPGVIPCDEDHVYIRIRRADNKDVKKLKDAGIPTEFDTTLGIRLSLIAPVDIHDGYEGFRENRLWACVWGDCVTDVYLYTIEDIKNYMKPKERKCECCGQIIVEEKCEHTPSYNGLSALFG
jgi:hypothetical protein